MFAPACFTSLYFRKGWLLCQGLPVELANFKGGDEIAAKALLFHHWTKGIRVWWKQVVPTNTSKVRIDMYHCVLPMELLGSFKDLED